MGGRKTVISGEEFIFCNGAVARSVAECRKHLAKLSDDEFRFHVNEQKHDFYEWINDCLDPGLAERIRDITDHVALVEALKAQ